ncbi:MAG TPA: hypothetical protein VG099_07530 [Gemmataceae bacterium]|jgi:hypothetical protein|nr:hypothetical protein [Gemmataceae bacterium]
MTVESFESKLRTLLHRRPFNAFALEMDDGRQIIVDDPEALSFGGGSVGFIGPEEIYLLRCENVRAIRPDVQEATP